VGSLAVGKHADASVREPATSRRTTQLHAGPTPAHPAAIIHPGLRGGGWRAEGANEVGHRTVVGDVVSSRCCCSRTHVQARLSPREDLPRGCGKGHRGMDYISDGHEPTLNSHEVLSTQSPNSWSKLSGGCDGPLDDMHSFGCHRERKVSTYRVSAGRSMRLGR